MSFELPHLPFGKADLEPHISAETLEYHHGKHHQGYVDKTNKFVEGTRFEGESLEEIIRGADGNVFNNGAQVWNHTFYWSCMKPAGGGRPEGALADAVTSAFGGYDEFREQFTHAALTQFGSGWAWLVLDADNGLEVVKTLNADNPLRRGQTPLLTIDVWEHAYYLDYRNARPKYVESFLDNLVSWDFVADNFRKARG